MVLESESGLETPDMKSIKKWISIGLVVLAYSHVSYATTDYGKPISLQVKDLKRWNKSREAWAIQQPTRKKQKSGQRSKFI